MEIISGIHGVKLKAITAGVLALFMNGVVVAAGTTLESRNTAGDIAAGTSFTGGTVDSLAISADGRYVVFASGATNLVADDTNGWNDIFTA
jgi:hypothetical protein